MPERKQTGEWRKCQGCGKDIYVRKYRVGNEHIGNYCIQCRRGLRLPRQLRKPIVMACIPCGLEAKYSHGEEIVCKRCGSQFAIRIE